MEISDELNEKLEQLKSYLMDLGSLAVGFSGGVDSTFLLYVAHEVLGDWAIAVTAHDASFPERELDLARDFCKTHGIRHFIKEIDPLEEENYRHNSPDRCYYCKRLIFTELKKIATENGVEYVAEGSNMDDLGDYRPGLLAVTELGITNPLRMAGMTKSDIRALSQAFDLPTWDKPSFACLASRFVYGEEITKEKLHMVDLAEQVLIDNGFYSERVRFHGNLARIEVPAEDIPRIIKDDIRLKIYDEFKKIGFLYVALDMKGYRTGSMNEALPDKKN